jgi:hypothetical protein
MGIFRPLGEGPGPVTLAADTSVAVPVGAARSFWVHSTVITWITVTNDGTPFTLDETNATLIAANAVYGPFQFMTGYDTHVHLAGDGVTGAAIVTLA